MYDFYLDNILLPVAPSKMQLKIKNQNKTFTLINEGEINVLKDAGLTDVSFSALIPQQQYPFAVYKNGFQRAEFFLEEIEKLKLKKEPFMFKVVRMLPDGKILFGTELKVSLESYKIGEDIKEGFDLNVDIDLKQYRDYSTKILNLEPSNEETSSDNNTSEEVIEATVEPQRETLNAPKTENYAVVKGDTLWTIAKRYYNDGTLYTKIAETNPSITDPNKIYPGQVLVIPEI